uniref:interleukin-1 receptor type 1-like n=1 Tax=Monopterus albus TaxID=43700 RepID=UPI0009B4C8B2|nr:interleukin-1 receptor type 1-like [Monopterus albus]
MWGVVVRMVKMLLVLLLLLLTLLSGASPQKPRQIIVKAGEMVVLECPRHIGYNHGETKLVWTSYTRQEMYMTTDVSSVEQVPMGVFVLGRSLVILSASVNHQGNYSCSLGNDSRPFWFRLTVYTAQSREYDKRTKHPVTCYTNESCKMHCPDVNIPAANILNITNNGFIWHKEGESLPKSSYFSSVEMTDHGVYTCTRSYLYRGQMYNMTFTVELDVKHKRKYGQSVILSPRDGVFDVDLGSTVVIDCKAVLYSDFDEVFWLSEESFVETNNNLSVFYNYTRETNIDEIWMTATLVFVKVSEEDLFKRYTCKLESVSELSSFVTITLAQKRIKSPNLALSIVGILVVIIVTVVVYVKFKIDIILFLRDTLGCYRSTSDGKHYDAYLMCYKSDAVTGLNEDNTKWLESILEEKFGYHLCLYNRDILPGKAEAEAVLNCVKQSRVVVLVPSSPDSGQGADVLNDIHTVLVEQQTRLVFIKTDTMEVSSSGSLPEALQLLSETGDCVTWKGTASMLPSSSFLQLLRYYLPAPQHESKIRQIP